MTREEFDRNITWFSDMWQIVDEYGWYGLEEYCDGYTKDERVNEEMYERCRYESWRSIRDWLDDIPEGDDNDWYYVGDGGYDLCGDDDFSYLKDECRQWLEDNGYFDDETEEEQAPETQAEENEPEDDDFELDFSFDELFSESRIQIMTVETTEEDDDEAEAMIQTLMYA